MHLLSASESKSDDIREDARRFFATKGTLYQYDDLSKLLGVYDMYRPYWLVRRSRDFMRSRVRILKRNEHYVFTEFQHFPNEEQKDICAGYLFPSGQGILAICKSRSARYIKVISISSLRKDPHRFERLTNFSGTLLAMSDRPPHPGNGFFCVRNDNSKRLSDKISEKEMKAKNNIAIYENIMLNQIHSEMDLDAMRKFLPSN